MNSPDFISLPQAASERETADQATRFRVILVSAFVILVVCLYVLADRLALRAEQDALHRLARSHAELVIAFRNFYSSRLLPIVREHSQLMITHDYRNRPAALPIPATLTLDLIEEVARSHPEMNLRLVSPYPFPWRKHGLDAFETEALAALQTSGNDEFMRIETAPGGKVLRYAAPIRLEESCVACHNNHPDSPKRDWKAGDVRGIQVMSLPLEGLSYDNHPQHFLFATLLLLAFGMAGGVLIWLHGRGVEALRLAQASAEGLRNRQLALDAHAIVSITDRAGRIIYANDQFCAISGYSREELLGQFHRILKSGLHPDAFYADLWATIASGKVWQGEICNRKKDGGLYWVKSTVFPFLDAHGKPFQFIAIRTDITERKAFEAELLAKRVEAESASRAKSDFLANMSHEIRTPMNGIIGMSDLALEADSEVERIEYIRIVRNSAESLLGILNDILDFSKIEANKLMLERVGFGLRQVLSETLRTLAPRAAQKGLELICDIGADVPDNVIGDPTRLRQVLINLIGNGIKFTEHGNIVISLAVEARSDASVTVQFAVRDSGVGIPADKIESIFEAFSQADASTTRQYGGTGLGLSISSRLVELMGGHMSVDSEVGQGSTFQFTVVLGVDATPVTPLASEHLKGKRVLIVDDNAVNREILMRQLQRWGMQALAVPSGREALSACGQSGCQPDLLLLDQHMPEMDGITLAGWLREQPPLRDTPLLILSSGPLKEDAERARRLGLHGYLTKPVTDHDLLIAVRRALGELEVAPAVNQPAPSRSGRFEVALDVLLVEDNVINQQLVIRLLERWGHRVGLAVNGQEAVDRLCAGERHDIVLMDMQMPVMGGVEATRLIRAHEMANQWPRVPIIAMTANAMQGDRESCLEAGMDDYLSKPINQVDLAAKLRQFSPRASGSDAGQGTEADPGQPTAPAFDYAQALARMDAEIVEILAPAFVEHYRNELDRLRQAIDANDAEAVMRYAHGLKGTLAALGAAPAERHAAGIEVLAKAGDLAGVSTRLPELEHEIALLVAVLPV